MSIKRILSGIILFPIFALILIFGNKYIVDVFISIVAIMSLHEFYKAFKEKASLFNGQDILLQDLYHYSSNTK